MNELRPAIFAPACALAGTLAGVAVGLMSTPHHVTREMVPMALPIAVPVPAPVPIDRAPMSSELSLVFKVASTTYVKIGDADPLPKHGRVSLIDDDGIYVAIAHVEGSDLPAAARGWVSRTVKVDNTCSAHVTGFAVVARVTGSPDYADAGTWTAKSVLAHGETVLAARLDGCTGTYARAAALPDVVVPEALEGREDLIAAARARVIASGPALEAQRAWHDEFGAPGKWYDDPETTFTTRVLRHPTTGVTWISVHAYNEGGCGDPEANVWGLFRVNGDALETVQLRRMELTNLDHIIDIEGDGDFELIGPAWPATQLERTSGDKLDSLGVAFYGCGC